MNDHLDPETLSAYIDEEIEVLERDRIESHITRCLDCRTVLELLRGAASAVARWEDVDATPDEHRLIRQALLDARRPIRRWGPIWGLAGVAALVVAGVFGFLRLPTRSNEAGIDTAAKPMSVPQKARSFAFASDEQIRSVVASQEQVISGIDKFTVADVGTQQEPAILLALSSQRFAALSRTEDGEAGSASPSALFDPVAGEICIRKVLRSQPYPMIPLLAKEATYKEKPAWLLVYAFTADQTSASRLDRAQIWLISPEECSRLEGSELINAAYHYSFYKKP